MASTVCRRLFGPCIRNRRSLLYVLILYGIATYFLKDYIWNALNHLNLRTETSTEDAPKRRLLFLQMLGRLQHYALGKYLRNMYGGFLNHSVQEVDCLSSITYRCLFGAYSFLAAFYPAPPGKRMDDDLSYQPIACSFEPLEKDKYLQSAPNCPACEMDKYVMNMTREAKQFMSRYQDLYRFWSEKSGLRIFSYGTAGSLYKTLLAEKTENLTIPDWAESTWESLRENSDICYHFNFKTRLLQRLKAGPLLEEILKKMRNKIENPNSKLKVYVYSGHGTNVAAVLNALRVFNHRIPTYGATILFELYQEVRGSHTVRLLLSNATEPEKHIPPPHVLQLPGCTEYCPLEEMERQTADLFPLDWENECQERDEDRLKKLLEE